METALVAIVALACPLGMLLMGVVMWKGMRPKREARARNRAWTTCAPSTTGWAARSSGSSGLRTTPTASR